MPLIYLFLVIVGVMNAMQAGSNSTLHKQLQHPVLPALVSFAAGTTALLVIFGIQSIVTKTPMPTIQQWLSPPWWAWVGGLFGALYVLAMVNCADKVGAAIFTGITVGSSVLMSLAMDHFGLLGFKQHSASGPRLAGAALIAGGLFLVSRS